MNRNLTNLIRIFMDEWLPPVIRDSNWFMYPFFYIWFKGKNIRTYMDFKSLAYSMSDEEFSDVYRNLDCMAKDRPTDMNDECVDFILKNLDSSAKTVLDVGCGLGYFINKVHDLGKFETFGCDVLPSAPIKGTFVQGSIDALPFPDNSFDIVTCNHTIEHIRDPEKAISELKRVAKKQVIIVTPCQRYYFYTLDLHLNFYPIQSILEHAIKMTTHDCRNLGGDWVFIGKKKS